jgi:hypothetical protein
VSLRTFACRHDRTVGTMPERLDISDALARAARQINAPTDLGSTLDTIVATAATSLPGIDHVGVTIAHRDGKMETKAATGPFVWELDQLQYDLAEGPCIHAIEAETIVKIEHARLEQRWPRFMAQAVKRGCGPSSGYASTSRTRPSAD